MSWVRIDDQFPDHQKIVGLSNEAFRVHVSAMCFCSAQLTDGRVTRYVTRRVTWFVTEPDAVINELVAAGLWEIDGDDFIIHDYLEYNPSAEDVKQQRKANADRQAKHRNGKRNGESNTVSNALRNASVTTPPSPSPSDDDEREIALKDLQGLGLFNSTMLAQFDDMWSELAGRRDWIGRAITVARDSNARSPLSYALKVLANAIHTGNPPGYTNGQSKIVSMGATTSKPAFTPAELDKIARKQELYEQLLSEGVFDPFEQDRRYKEAGLL